METSRAPICRDHGLRIILCKDCCIRIWEEAGLLPETERHYWACANVYVSESEW